MVKKKNGLSLQSRLFALQTIMNPTYDEAIGYFYITYQDGTGQLQSRPYNDAFDHDRVHAHPEGFMCISIISTTPYTPWTVVKISHPKREDADKNGIGTFYGTILGHKFGIDMDWNKMEAAICATYP